MLTEKMVSCLNTQLNLEFYSANLYLQMSAWCSSKGFEGAAEFLKKHSKEEMDHMQRLFDYLVDAGSLPVLGAITAPPTKFNSLAEVFDATYQHEQKITQEINKLVHEALTSQDYSTFNFLQWYVAEQHEEEKLFKTVLDKMGMLENSSNGLFLIDKDLARMNENNLTGN